ncbi:N-6 DNA methylase [Citrobacter portucalensis]|uniref:N-6 DNA methylase n=1 Tax=Citrobacter portucalensis TaxID=1639133 RepID=UPI002889035B|nr:N-6 DNA methylase [Citrobacter portucalensis]WNI88216.1 N-6 DNA methylase [Citrobacter portucalensis]HCC2281432.1 N-6 DNA methylase [Klebsiella quasipneumoniae]
MSLQAPLEYNKILREIISSSSKGHAIKSIDLDEIDSILRDSLSIKNMREAGSFFTGLKLATKTLDSFLEPIKINSVVLDPTCGAGNLLVACSRRFSIYPTLTQTLSIWGQQLKGFDLYEIFVESAKLRIIIDALNRGAKKDCDIDIALTLLPNIKVKNALDVCEMDLKDITHVVMNPPFTITPSPNNYYWKKGKVNSAGIFMDKYIRLLPAGCCVSAILPDVLRSGSRYEEFRTFIDCNLIGTCNIWGRFNAKTDVDVFILSGKIKRYLNSRLPWSPNLGKYMQLSSQYDVRVGPLVAYRDHQEGEEHPYFHPKNSPAWEIISKVSETRKFKGTTIIPPFIVVKRTSSPTDKFRASATIINLDLPVAVENHMIVIRPKDSSFESCLKLMKILKSEKTNNFLNNRIRTRHLTVGVIKEIPI